MSIFDEGTLALYVKRYLNNEIKNPILLKVVEEDIIYNNTISNILKDYFSDAINQNNYDNKFNSLNTLIKNVSIDNYNYLREQITNTFVNLDVDQQILLIVNITPITENIFGIMNNNTTTSNILKNILSGLCVGVNDEYIIKCIKSCKTINKNIADSIVIEYIQNNGCDIVMNDNLLTYFLKYISESKINVYDNIFSVINVKLSSIMSHLTTIPLINMDFGYEIFKLGKVIIDSNLKFRKDYYWSLDIILLSDEQLEYIAKVVHTCIVNKNISQAQTIHAIIYYMSDNQISKYMKYYNKYLQSRIKSLDNQSIIYDEYAIWNINNEYKNIINQCNITEYKQYINNIKNGILINNDMQKVRIKNSKIAMNKITVKLDSILSNNIENVKHHPIIDEYLNNLNRYIDIRAPLQNLEYSSVESIIKFKTNMGSIKCSLAIGSCLLYLKDSSMSINDLSLLSNIPNDKVQNIIDTLYFNNLVINENDSIFKYVEPFGDVDCSKIITKSKETEDIVVNTFSDIIITMDSRIMKEVKPQKMNIMELERRIVEFMGNSYVRNIFYQRIASLKKRYYIKEIDSIIEYNV